VQVCGYKANQKKGCSLHYQLNNTKRTKTAKLHSQKHMSKMMFIQVALYLWKGISQSAGSLAEVPPQFARAGFAV
jgi:hypothetical protein